MRVLDVAPAPSARARKRLELAPTKAVVDAWVRYHDAAGYILLGDPVLKISSTASGTRAR